MKKHLLLKSIIFLYTLLLAFSYEAGAFVLSKASKQYQHWPSSQIPVVYKINTSQLPPGGIEAITNAFQTWQDVTNASISFTYGGPTSTNTVADDGENVIFFVTESGSWTHGNAAAYTRVWVSTATGEIHDADMEINATPEFLATYSWSTSGESGKLDLENMVTHEAGHFIGIDHNCDPGVETCSAVEQDATMYPLMALGETKKRSLEPDDIDAVSFLYPANPVTIEIVSGNDQSAASGIPLAEPLVVRVVDSGENPLPDSLVIFDILFGSGTLTDPDFMLTDAAGEAQNSFTPGVDTKIVVRAVAAGLKSQVFWVNNHVPGLNWTGETNYIGDGLDPETGYSNTDFVFRIKYTDSDNDAHFYFALHRDIEFLICVFIFDMMSNLVKFISNCREIMEIRTLVAFDNYLVNFPDISSLEAHIRK